MPDKRYIGALGAVCWATRSGTTIRHNEHIRIERTKPQPTTRGKGKKAVSTQKQDNVVRFTNSRGEEIGRLETDFATWVAPLIDQKICVFEGTCVFAPEKVRTNDTIYLQLRAYFVRTAFEKDAFVKPENNRQTGLFEQKETQDEKDLHSRQLALVKLFNEINLQPSRSNAATEKHKRQGILQAAEVAERYSHKPSTPDGTKKESNGDGPSTPIEEAEEGEELQEDQIDTLYKKAQSFDFDTPEYQPAETFAMDLRKYQKQALHWLISKERNTKADRKEFSIHPLWEEYLWPMKDVDEKDVVQVEGQDAFYVNPYSGEMSLEFPVQEQNCLGGILADEMGLGKTIEMMSLIHSNRSEISLQAVKKEGGSATSVNDLPRMSKSSTGVESAPCTTLVVAPMSLLAQWQSEAERASIEGSMKVLMYYGTEKAVDLRNLCCEANAASAPNVIITSYGTILSEFGQIASSGGNRAAHGGIFSLDYYRVILDEAHTIKNRQSKTAKACYEIQAKHRWVLTGTPIVNRLEDLFSLVHFLRVEPWSNFSFWKTFITVPFESKDYIKALDVVQTVLEPLVLRRTKDMKTPDGSALVPLPQKTIEVEKVELTEDERAVYNLFFLRAKRTFSANVEAGTLMKSYTTIFAQILRLRQSCCHPVLTRNKTIVADEEDAAAAADIANGLADDMDLAALIERFEADMDEGEQDANKFGAHALKQIQDEAENECPICAEEPMNEQTVTPCWHSACKKCLVDYIEHQKDKGELPRCFNCREPVNLKDVFEVVRHDDEPSSPASIKDEGLYDAQASKRISLRRLNQPSSAKITALLSHLKSIRRTAPYTKSVIFSQFTSFLDLIEPSLEKEGIPFLRFDGSMAQKQRAAVLTEFAETCGKNKGVVLLLSLRAGGVGLNLTMAERVFMMDPWWSWAVEAQAVDRVHRMGQEKEVKVIRFVCEDSIEEKMLKIQERKKFIASSLGMMSESERKLQRMEDIKELLS
jgi:DNA repair protein RAD5